MATNRWWTLKQLLKVLYDNGFQRDHTGGTPPTWTKKSGDLWIDDGKGAGDKWPIYRWLDNRWVLLATYDPQTGRAEFVAHEEIVSSVVAPKKPIESDLWWQINPQGKWIERVYLEGKWVPTGRQYDQVYKKIIMTEDVGGLKHVRHDDTLYGSGTDKDPLGRYLVTTSSLKGKGIAGSPLDIVKEKLFDGSIWLDADNGNDANEGRTPHTPVKTLDRAFEIGAWFQRITIFLLSDVYMTKFYQPLCNNIVFVGTDKYRKSAKRLMTRKKGWADNSPDTLGVFNTPCFRFSGVAYLSFWWVDLTLPPEDTIKHKAYIAFTMATSIMGLTFVNSILTGPGDGHKAYLYSVLTPVKIMAAGGLTAKGMAGCFIEGVKAGTLVEATRDFFCLTLRTL